MARIVSTSAQHQRPGTAVVRGSVWAVGVWLALLLMPAAASAGAWPTPVLVPGAQGVPADVATDGRGTAVALLRQFPTGLAAVWLPAGQPPGMPQSLSSLAVSGDVAMDAHGNAVAVWIEGAAVRSAVKPADGMWSPPQDLVVPTDANASGSRVAMSADGLAVATWTRGGVVQAAVKDVSSADFGAPEDLADNSADPDVAVSPGGDSVIVWTRFPAPGQTAIQGAARPAGGVFSQMADVARADGSRLPLVARVAMDGLGRATAVWDERHLRDFCHPELEECPRHDFVDVRAAERGHSGDFGPAQTIATSTMSWARHQVVVGPDGTAVVAWLDGYGNSKNYYHAYLVRWSDRPAGGSFTVPRGVFRESDGISGRPEFALAMAPDGAALLLAHVMGPYAGDGVVASVLQSSLRPAGGDFQPPQDVARAAGSPVLAFADGSHAVALWTDNGVRAARYDRNAPAPDPDLIFNGGFETNLAEWNTSSATGVALTREAGGHSGEWAAKVANTGTTPSSCVLSDRPFFPLVTAAGTYTATLWVRAATAGQTLKLRVREYGQTGALVGTEVTSVALTTSWQPLEVTYTPSAPGSSTLDLHVYINDAAPGTCFFADDASLRLGPTPSAPDPNLAPNGGFEHSITGWNTSGSAAGAMLSREPGGHTGGWAGMVTNGAGTAGTCALNDSPNIVATTEAGEYAAGLWVRAPAGGQTLKLKLREYAKAGGSLLGSQTATVALSPSWQHVTVAYSPSAPGSSTLDLNAYVSSAAPGTCFLADDASLVHDPPPPPPDPNLVTNAGFESSLSGWNTSGSAAGVVLTREAGGHSGDWAAMVANGGAATGTCTLQDSPNVVASTEPGTYTATLWIRAPTPGQTLRLRLREYSGGTLVGSQVTPVTLTTSWQQISVTYTAAAPGGSTLDLHAYVSGAPPGTCFVADDATIERHP